MPSRCVDMRDDLPRHATKRYQVRRGGMGDVFNIVVHHSGPAPLDMTAEQAAVATANYHIGPHGDPPQEWPGCAYHTIVVPSGDWAYCNDLRVVSYHVGDFNPVSVGLCLWGDYREAPVPAAMVDSLEEICRWVMQEKRAWAEDAGRAYVAPAIVGHRQLMETSCPGRFGLEAVAEVKRRLG